MRRRVKTLPWLAAAVGVTIAGAILADLSGILRPLPEPQALLKRMETAWQKAPGYHAEVSIGDWGAGGAGAPSTSLQSFWKDGDELALATQDMAGFRHAERWKGEAWSYYQPGAEIQANVHVANSGEVPFARWFVTGYPTLGDLVTVVTQARDARVLGREPLTSGSAWTLECHPVLPAATGGAAVKGLSDFYQRHFTRTWKVWISEQTLLPVHIWMTGDPSEPVIRVGVDNLRLETPPRPADWREVLGDRRKPAREIPLRVDLRSPGALASARAQIQSKVDAWRKPLLQGAARPR
jgi:hypothetical protein